MESIFGQTEKVEHLSSRVEMGVARLLPESERGDPDRDETILAERKSEVRMRDDVKRKFAVAPAMDELAGCSFTSRTARPSQKRPVVRNNLVRPDLCHPNCDQCRWDVRSCRGAQTALCEHHREDLRLELIYKPDAVENMREMVRREQRCCAFLSFSIHENQDVVRVVIRVPPEARELARMVFESFLGKAAIVPGIRRRYC